MLVVNLPVKFLSLRVVLDACPAVRVDKALCWIRRKINAFQYQNALTCEQSNDKLKQLLLNLQCFLLQQIVEMRVGNGAVMTFTN